MNRKIQHTPDGVRDIYDRECRNKLELENGIRLVLNRYGYRDIETPTFEFFDVFGSEVGTIPSNQLYKFFDREGNTLVLRPDFTPSIARAASRYFGGQAEPIRLCYKGNTFVSNSDYRGRLNESTQMGAELIGDAGVEADWEILSMVIDAILSTGMEEFQISLGNVQYFRSLLLQAGLDEQEGEELAGLIRNKNSFGVRRMLAEKDLPDNVREALIALPMASGGPEVLEQARALVGKDPETARSLDRLSEVYHLLELCTLDRYVSFDLGMMSSYMYYTGIIFRGYTYGSGEAIVKGGRYDELLAHFGTDEPSIGFVIVIPALMNALLRQKVMPEVKQQTLRILYLPEDARQAVIEARRLREAGTCVEMLRAEHAAQADTLEASARAQGMKTLRIGGLT